MFTIKNMRKETENGWTSLKCDFEVTGINSPFAEKEIWIAVENKNANMIKVIYDIIFAMFIYDVLYVDIFTLLLFVIESSK